MEAVLSKIVFYPPFNQQRKQYKNIIKKKAAEYEAEIQRAKAVEIQNAQKTPEELLDNLPQDEELNIKAAKDEITEFQQQENINEVNPDIQAIIRNTQLSEDFLDEDMSFELSKTNPSEFAKNNIESAKRNGKKVKDMLTHVGETFVNEAKEEVRNMINNEIQEFEQNPRKYAGKCSKEFAKFSLNPPRYVTKTVVKFGTQVTVNTAFTLTGEAKDAVMTQEYRGNHPYVSTIMDGAYDGLVEAKVRISGKAVKNTRNMVNNAFKQRFKEISLRRKRALSLTKSKAKALAQAETRNPFMSSRIKSYLQNRIRGILSNKLTAFNYERDLTENQKLGGEIITKIAREFTPFVKTFACNFIVNLITDFFGPGAFKYILKVKQIYDIVKGVYDAYNQTDIVQKWTLFGRSIGKGIKLFKVDNTLSPCSNLKRRRFKKFRKH